MITDVAGAHASEGFRQFESARATSSSLALSLKQRELKQHERCFNAAQGKARAEYVAVPIRVYGLGVLLILEQYLLHVAWLAPHPKLSDTNLDTTPVEPPFICLATL